MYVLGSLKNHQIIVKERANFLSTLLSKQYTNIYLKVTKDIIRKIEKHSELFWPLWNAKLIISN